MRSASDRRPAIGLGVGVGVGLLGAIFLLAHGCARVTLTDAPGAGGDGGDGGDGGSAGGGSAGMGGDGGTSGDGGTGGAVIGGRGGSGPGGSTGGSAATGGTGGTGGSGGTGGAGGRGGSGGSAGTGGTTGSGGSAGTGGTAGTVGTAGTGGAGGRGGSGGTGGSGGGGTGGGGTGGGGTGGSAPVSPTVVGSLVISELMHNPVAVDDTLGEWFELYNPSATVTYDIRNCMIDDIGVGGAATISAQVLIPPRAFVALAISSTPGFTPAYAYGSVRFDNDAAEEANFSCNGILIDKFPYDGPAATDPASAGRTFTVDPDFLTATGNDVRANWCYATTEYGSGTIKDFGTPNMPNQQCP